jgi:hypothetical protein
MQYHQSDMIYQLEQALKAQLQRRLPRPSSVWSQEQLQLLPSMRHELGASLCAKVLVERGKMLHSLPPLV